MTRSLADRVVGLKPSATVEMTERVRAARESGRKIIGLSSGDPNIDTDPRIIAAGGFSAQEGYDSQLAGEPDRPSAFFGRHRARTRIRETARSVDSLRPGVLRPPLHRRFLQSSAPARRQGPRLRDRQSFQDLWD